MIDAPSADLVLKCQPGKEGNRLFFAYSVENRSAADAYVMAAVASIDPASGLMKASPRTTVVIAGAADDAIVGTFMAPLPTDRRMAVSITPLAKRLAAGSTLQGRCEVPLPFAETSPYFGDLPLRQYEPIEIKSVIFAIDYWIAGVDGMAAVALDDAPDLFSVVTRNTQRSARHLSQRFSTYSLQLLKRADQYPRDVPGVSVGQPRKAS